jgi:hypothetical protein
MKKILFLIVLPVLFAQFLLFVPLASPALADGPLDLNNQEGFGGKGGASISRVFGGQSAPTDIRIIVSNIIKVVLSLLGIIFVVLLIFGGFKWMTAAGNEDAISDAKKLIIQAVIGLAIILSAYAITVFISDALINAIKKPLF